jgi:hypothetical protein
MSFGNHLSEAITHAGLVACDELARTLWKGVAAGTIPDDQAEALSGQLEARRRALRDKAWQPAAGPPKPLWRSPSRFPPRRVQVPPDRRKSIERRRRLAASGPMPPGLACKFTTGELAILKIVADEVRAHGVCDLSYDEIAARAGCCRSLARRAIRLARRMGLLTIEERPRPGQKHLTNLVRVRSPEWRAWLRLDYRGHGRTPHGYQDQKGFRIKAASATLGSGDRAGERGVVRFGQSGGESGRESRWRA